MDWNEAAKLRFDLLNDHRRACRHNGDARKAGDVVSFSNCQAVDIVATTGIQADDAR